MENNSIIFGAQYYRAPTPAKDQWESDIKNIKEHGFNTIKIWAQWRSNNPREGIYKFDDLDALMDLSAKYGIKVIINIIMDVAPAWFFEKYPDSIMITASGLKLYPQTTAYRQIGGAPGPCYHHKEAIKYKNEFVLKLAERYANHEALLLWDLWNEPEMTCGIAREPYLSNMVCYCEATSNAFKLWLENKYKTIEALNEAWQRDYENFDKVELPRNPYVYNDMIDWRNFFADTLIEDLKLRVQNVKKYDNIHPVMIHTVPIPYFNMINSCCDDYKMAKLCDVFGNSIGSLPFPAALSVSSAKGKKIINAEIHAVGGETFNRPKISEYFDFKKQIFTPLAKGIKGFLFWQYRPELYGRESPAWGLTDLEGNSCNRLEFAKKINNALQKNCDILASAMPQKSRIAIIKDNNNEIFTWCANDSVEKYYKSLTGAFDCFYKLNYNVDIITSDQLKEEGLSQYSLVYYPIPYYMSSDIAEKLKEYVISGGMLVSEAFFGAYKAEDSFHSTKIPGYGFDEVFGVKEGEATTTSTFVAAYGEKWYIDNNDKNLIPVKISNKDAEYDIAGYFFIEELIPTTGKAIGYFSSGMPTIVENNYGKGKTVICGTLMGAAFDTSKNKNNLRFFKELADKAMVEPTAFVDIPDIRVDILEADQGVAIVVNNDSGFDGEVMIKLNLNNLFGRKFIDIESEEIYNLSLDNELKVEIKAFEVKVFRSI